MLFIFGHAVFRHEHVRLSQALRSLGYAARHLEQFLSNVLCLDAGKRRSAVGDIHRGTATEGPTASKRRCREIGRKGISRPRCHGDFGETFTHARLYLLAGEKHRRHRSDLGNVVPSMARYSTLRPRTRESNYSFILRTGVWLAREQSGMAAPTDWSMSTCAAFIAAVDRMTVGEGLWSQRREHS